jgi:thiamine-monophosphate kinase
LDVVVIGQVETPVLRSTARIGDEVWVTGTLGGAAAAVAAWLSGQTPSEGARERYGHPFARVPEAHFLKHYVHAMIDLSDGIAGDGAHIAAASHCRLVIDAARLPVHPAADIELALRGGEDYELCVTAPAGALEKVQHEFERRFRIPLTRIGDVVAGEGVVIPDFDVHGAFDHFSAGRS